MCSYKSIFIIVCVLVLFNCKQEAEIVFSDVNITTPSNRVVELNILQPTGNSKIANRIGAEIKKLTASILNIKANKNASSLTLEDTIDAFNAEYLIFQKNFPDIKQIWEAQIDAEVMWQSKEIASIALTSYINTGGAHGALKIHFLNFDLKTGKRIDNLRLVKNTVEFAVKAKPYFEKAIINKGTSYDVNQFVLPENMGYSEDGLVLLYNINEFATYTNDIVEFTIPFKEIKSYLIFNSF